MRIYLAGPIRGKTYDESVGWREFATHKLGLMGHVCASPMRGKEYLQGKGPMDGSCLDGSYPEYVMSSAQGLFRRDTFDVSMADAILANLEDTTECSIGTCMEIQRGFDLGKYVVTVLKNGSIHDHAFIRQASSVVVDGLGEALNIFRAVGEPYARYVLRG